MEILTILGSPHGPAVSTILAHQLVKGARAAANCVTIFDAGHHPLAPGRMDADNHSGGQRMMPSILWPPL